MSVRTYPVTFSTKFSTLWTSRYHYMYSSTSIHLGLLTGRSPDSSCSTRLRFFFKCQASCGPVRVLLLLVRCAVPHQLSASFWHFDASRTRPNSRTAMIPRTRVHVLDYHGTAAGIKIKVWDRPKTRYPAWYWIL
jgi:hypothetical protein